MQRAGTLHTLGLRARCTTSVMAAGRSPQRGHRIMTTVELIPIADIYTDGVGAVELLGGNVRIIYYTWEGPPGERDKVIVAKLVMPIKAMTERALGKMLSEQLAAQRMTAGEDEDEEEAAAHWMPIPGSH